MFNSVGSRSATAYRKIGVETQVDQADPHALVEMLFDGLGDKCSAEEAQRLGMIWRCVDDAALAEVQNLLEPISTGWKQMGVAISPSLKAA